MTITVDARLRPAVQARYFHVLMAACCVAIAFLGFAPTYWLPLAAGTFKAHPVVHIHGLVFFSWTLFFLFQAWLVASGRTARHRSIGLIGISLATMMTMLGIITAINQTKGAIAIGQAEAGKAFAIVPLAGIAFFAVAVAVAIAEVRRPEIHRRLMLLASISILDAPIARWFLTFLAPPGPPGPPPVAADIGPAAVTWLLLGAAIFYDWRRTGRPHPIYLIGGAALVAVKLMQIPLSTTAVWHSLAEWLVSLAS
jgi:hypothetical protein